MIRLVRTAGVNWDVGRQQQELLGFAAGSVALAGAVLLAGHYAQMMDRPSPQAKIEHCFLHLGPLYEF
jgi:hypothetical protein